MTHQRLSSALRLAVSLFSSSCVLDRSAIELPCSDESCDEPGDLPNSLSPSPTDEPRESDARANVATDGSTPQPLPSDGGAAPPQVLAKLRPTAEKMPALEGACPELKAGLVQFGDITVRLWMGSDGEKKLGPAVFYWHSDLAHVDEAVTALGAEVIAEVVAQGGVVIAPEQTVDEGVTVGTQWNTGDVELADKVLACVVAGGVGIDPGRIHAVGFGSGGMMTSYMAFARSNYLASVVSFSGGLTTTWWINSTMQDPTNVVPAMLVHGRLADDFLLIDYAVSSATMASELKQRGGFVVDCVHEVGHRIPTGYGAPTLRFLSDHPYRTSPSPYARALPTALPSSCLIK